MNNKQILNYLNWQENIIHELVRLIRDNGSIVWQVGNYIENAEVYPLDIYFYPIFKKMGMQLRNRIIWHFDHGLHAKKSIFPADMKFYCGLLKQITTFLTLIQSEFHQSTQVNCIIKVIK